MKLVLAMVLALGCCMLADPVRADDKKAEAKGTLTMGDKTYKMESAVAYECTRGNKKRTTILLSEQAPDLDKLKASLKKKGNDDEYFQFKPHIKLIFTDKGALFQVVIFADGANINEIESDNYKATFAIKDGVASGKANQLKPDKISNMTYTFEVTYDAKVVKP